MLALFLDIHVNIVPFLKLFLLYYMNICYFCSIINFFEVIFLLYFSGEGRLEVVKCRGEYRKVLQTGLTEAGPITLDITRG